MPSDQENNDQGKTSQSSIVREALGQIHLNIITNNYKIALLELITAKDPITSNYDALRKAKSASYSLEQELYRTNIKLNETTYKENVEIISTRQAKLIEDASDYRKKVGSLLNNPEALRKFLVEFSQKQAQDSLDYDNLVRGVLLDRQTQTDKILIMLRDKKAILQNYYNNTYYDILAGKIKDEAGLDANLFGDPSMVVNLELYGKNISLLAPMSKSKAEQLSLDSDGILKDADGNIIAASILTVVDGKTTENISLRPYDGKLDKDNYEQVKVTIDTRVETKIKNGLKITKTTGGGESPKISIYGTSNNDIIKVGKEISANDLAYTNFLSVEKLIIGQSATMQAPNVLSFSLGIVVATGVTLDLVDFSMLADLSNISGSMVASHLDKDTYITLSKASDQVLISSGNINIDSFDIKNDKISFKNGTKKHAAGDITVSQGEKALDPDAGTKVSIDASGAATSADMSAYSLANLLYNSSDFSGYVMIRDGNLGAYLVSKNASTTFAADEEGGSDAIMVHLAGINSLALNLDSIII